MNLWKTVKYDVLTILMLSIYEHGWLYIFIPSPVSLISLKVFTLQTDLSSPWLNLFLSILFFLCYCKWYCFLNFTLRYSLLVYRNATNICMLISTLLNLFISSDSFWWSLQKLLCIRSHHVQRKTILLLFQLEFIFFIIYLLFLIALVSFPVVCWI